MTTAFAFRLVATAIGAAVATYAFDSHAAPPPAEESAPADAAADAPPQTAAAGEASAAPTSDATDAASSEPAAPAPELSDEDFAEIKAEIMAELRAELEKAHRSEDHEHDEGHVQAEPAKAENEDDEEEVNPLMPPKQEELLGQHPISNEKSTFKPGKGAHLESADGAFALTTRLRAQMRYQLEADHDEEGTEYEHIFQIRRARLQFLGHAFNKHNKFKFEMAFSPSDLGMKDGVPHNTPLLTWYLEFDYLRDFTIRMGQYKIPYSRQRVVSSGNLQFVDRSITQGEFNHDRDIGLDVRSKDLGGLGGKLRYYAGVYMGEGRDFGGKNATKDFKLHYLARLEYLPMGKFKDYHEADLYRNLKPKLSLGVAYGFHDNAQKLRGTTGSGASDGGTTDYQSITADYSFKYKGFSSTGEFHWRKGGRQRGDVMVEDEMTGEMVPAPVEAARSGLGFFLQGGYLIPRVPLEIVARYSMIRPIGEADPGDLTSATETIGYTSLGKKDEVGGGIGYYFAGHPWKLQADYFRTWDDGVFAQGSDMARLQLQVAF